MLDDEDTEAWRQFAKPKLKAIRYIGVYVTASQWAYLARKNNSYYLIFVQHWFKKISVTPGLATDIADWDLPPGQWVTIPGQPWQRYEVREDTYLSKEQTPE